MITLILPETISMDREINTEAGCLDDLLHFMAKTNPVVFERIAIQTEGMFTLKSFVAIFINDKLTFDNNPRLLDGDCVSIELAISGG